MPPLVGLPVGLLVGLLVGLPGGPSGTGCCDRAARRHQRDQLAGRGDDADVAAAPRTDSEPLPTWWTGWSAGVRRGVTPDG